MRGRQLEKGCAEKTVYFHRLSLHATVHKWIRTFEEVFVDVTSSLLGNQHDGFFFCCFSSSTRHLGGNSIPYRSCNDK